MSKDNYGKRLGFGFRMRDDEFGTDDGDEIPLDFSDDDEDEPEEPPTYGLSKFLLRVFGVR